MFCRAMLEISGAERSSCIAIVRIFFSVSFGSATPLLASASVNAARAAGDSCSLVCPAAAAINSFVNSSRCTTLPRRGPPISRPMAVNGAPEPLTRGCVRISVATALLNFSFSAGSSCCRRSVSPRRR